MYLLCLVYLLLECGDGIGTVFFLRLCHACREAVKCSFKAMQTWRIGWLGLL